MCAGARRAGTESPCQRTDGGSLRMRMRMQIRTPNFWGPKPRMIAGIEHHSTYSRQVSTPCHIVLLPLAGSMSASTPGQAKEPKFFLGVSAMMELARLRGRPEGIRGPIVRASMPHISPTDPAGLQQNHEQREKPLAKFKPTRDKYDS